MSDDADNGDDDDSDVLDFEHIQRLDGSRFLKIHTEQTTFLVQVKRDDFEDLREAINNPPNVL
jgi:NAD kinase